MHKFNIRFKVTEDHLDENQHVNNIVYLKWAQFISGEHWNSVASDDMKNEYSWVVARNEIDYFRSIFLNDEVEMVTWIEATEKAKSHRVIEIYNTTRNELAAKAKIIWYALDAKTLKPKRIGSHVHEAFVSSKK